ncbi:MAG: hypothetical protein IT370_23925 [Deltaproteobacteria bacterium]|nr:hypothetical protein [Deltaproteobacteria bacterium]
MAGFQQTSFAFGPSPSPQDDRPDAQAPAPQAPAPQATTVLVRKSTRPARRAAERAVQLDLNDLLADADPVAARRRAAARLGQHLERQLPGPLHLGITENRSTMISVKRDPGPAYRVRLHHLFLEADATIIQALARYIADNDAAASELLGDHIDANTDRIVRVRRADALHTAGEVYDLGELYASLNARYFGGRIDARIGWGRRGGKRKRRSSIKMGSYIVEERLIRIHPTLDRPFVPRYFIEWIVFHEMLHQVHDIPTVDGRRQFHTPEFLAEERKFEHYAVARRWERDNLGRILNF